MMVARETPCGPLARTGYGHRLYVESFAHLGAPLALPASGGWLIERPIPCTELHDAMGSYPLFDCDDWTGLQRDLASLRHRLVSVTLVTNPFADVDERGLGASFDVVAPFKRHYVVDLHEFSEASLDRRHRRNVQRALRDVQVHECPDPLAYLDEWCMLYDELMRRHGGGGIGAVPRAAFEKQLRVPGIVMLRAATAEGTVGLHLWYVRDQVAYGHLGATNSRGYALMASYALYRHATQFFRDRVRWLNLGGVAGHSDTSGADGLRRFKAGWATGTRQAFLCGLVLQPDVYARLVSQFAPGHTDYFPAYRHGELAPVEELRSRAAPLP